MAGKRTSFLYLNESEMIRAGVLDSKHCVDVLDEMFKLIGQGDYIMGGPDRNEHGIRIYFPDHPQFPGMPQNGPDRRFMAMVGYLGGRFHTAGCKWYGSNVANLSRGLPRSILMVTLNDPDTCEPIAFMSGNLISGTRTGCVPGVGTRYLASPAAEVCSCIGARPISRSCLSGIMAEAHSIKKICVYDIRQEAAEEFAKWAGTKFGVEAVTCASTAEVVRAGDIISVAASKIKPVIVKNEWIKEGSLIVTTGGCQLDEAYLTSARIVFDNPLMHKAYMQDAHRSASGVDAIYASMLAGCVYKLIDAGKLPPLDEAVGLGDIAVGKAPGRTAEKDRILLETSGMPVEDIAWGYEIYRQAKAMGLGQELLLWDESYM